MHPVFILTIITTEGLLNLQKARLIQAECRRDRYWRGGGGGWRRGVEEREREASSLGGGLIVKVGIGPPILEHLWRTASAISKSYAAKLLVFLKNLKTLELYFVLLDAGLMSFSLVFANVLLRLFNVRTFFT